MNSKIASFLIASSLALGVPLIADAQNDPQRGPDQVQPRGEHRHGGAQRMFRRLELTETQREQVNRIFEEQRPALREQMEIARKAGQELRQAATAPNFDRNRARQLADTQAKALGEAAFLRADGMSRVVALLTPEQREKLQQQRNRGGHRRGNA